jgi:hypothetical protein
MPKKRGGAKARDDSDGDSDGGAAAGGGAAAAAGLPRPQDAARRCAPGCDAASHAPGQRVAARLRAAWRAQPLCGKAAASLPAPHTPGRGTALHGTVGGVACDDVGTAP